MKGRMTKTLTIGTTHKSAKLEFQFSFDIECSEHPKCLLANEATGELYLVGKGNGDYAIADDGNAISFDELDASKFTQVTLKQACAWYAICKPFSNSSHGNISILSKLAAEALD